MKYSNVYHAICEMAVFAVHSLGFLSGRKSAEDGTSGKPLFRLFNRETVDDIPTTLPRQLTPRRQNVCISDYIAHNHLLVQCIANHQQNLKFIMYI